MQQRIGQIRSQDAQDEVKVLDGANAKERKLARDRHRMIANKVPLLHCSEYGRTTRGTGHRIHAETLEMGRARLSSETFSSNRQQRGTVLLAVLQYLWTQQLRVADWREISTLRSYTSQQIDRFGTFMMRCGLY